MLITPFRTTAATKKKRKDGRKEGRKNMESHYPLSALCIWMRVGCLQKVYSTRRRRYGMAHSNTIWFFTLASLIRFVCSALIAGENILLENRCSKELMWTSMTAGLYSMKKSKDKQKKTPYAHTHPQHKSKENNTDYSNSTLHYVHTMHVKCQPFFHYNLPKSSLNIPPQPGWEARPPFG